MNYYIGKYKEDAPEHRGWFVGKFMDGIRQTDLVEVKYADGNMPTHPEKVSETLEIDIITQGTMSGTIDGKPVMLKAGDYVVIPPGTPNNLPEKISDDLIVFTIKAPSDPSAKKIIAEPSTQ